MLCPSCATENRDDASFWGECGAALSSDRPCATCARPNPARRKFCDARGGRLSETPAPRTPTPAPSPGLTASFADGRYRVKRLPGEGGGKRVYLARDTKLDRDVAIAAIKTEGLDDAGHPDIVAVFDVTNRPTAFAQAPSMSKARADPWPP